MIRDCLPLTRRSVLAALAAAVGARPLPLAAEAWPDASHYYWSALTFSAFLVAVNDEAVAKLRPALQASAQKISVSQKQIGEELKAVRDAAGALAPPRPWPGKDHPIYLMSLRQASPDHFEGLYLKIEWMEANKAMRLHRAYTRIGEVAPFKAIAKKATPALEEHCADLGKAFSRQL